VDADTKQVRLCDLRMNSCRWPLGGILEHVEFFCGEPCTAGSPYCKEHSKRAFARLIIRSSAKTPMVLKDLRKKGAGG
jgi:hypothetical protein